MPHTLSLKANVVVASGLADAREAAAEVLKRAVAVASVLTKDTSTTGRVILLPNDTVV